jgi:hypothetical protein
MQGVYEDPPGRPHPNCNCEITEFDRDGLHCHHEGEREIFNEAGGAVRVVQHFSVDCCCDGEGDGEDNTVEIPIESNEDWDTIARQVDAAIDGVEGDCAMEDCLIV